MASVLCGGLVADSDVRFTVLALRWWRMASGLRRLRPTLRAAGVSSYRRAGGPWDRAGLEAGFGCPRGPVVVDGDGRLDASTFEAAVAAVAGGLRRAGARRGEAVAWQLPNGAAAVVLYRACWRIGAVAAPVHHKMGAAEVTAALSQVAPAVVIATPGAPAGDHHGALSVAGHRGVTGLVECFPPGGGIPYGARRVSGTEVAAVLFTSGSTGVPKAVLHTHRGLGYKAALMAAVHGLVPGDAVLMPAPLAHVSGLLNGVLLPATVGGPSVLMASWDPADALASIEAEHVAFIGAPPIFFTQMADCQPLPLRRPSSLRLISTGGAAVTASFARRMADAFGCTVKRTYGSTEAPTVTTSTADDPAEKGWQTDGRPVGDAELLICDPGTGRPAEPGAAGEIWLRGPELFAGYAAQTATDAVIARPGGWFRTGDLGRTDDDGWLQVVGRLSDVIIRAGENITASEVEAILGAHPDIQQAVAVPVPDEAVGERVAAVVVATDRFGLEQCQAWFSAQGVTRFKTPELILQIGALPMLASGKPDRRALRAMAAMHFAAELHGA